MKPRPDEVPRKTGPRLIVKPRPIPWRKPPETPEEQYGQKAKDPMAEEGPLLDRPGLKGGINPPGGDPIPIPDMIPPPGGPDGPVFWKGPIWNIEGPVIPGDPWKTPPQGDPIPLGD